MTPSYLAYRIDALRALTDQVMTELADRVRSENVIPYCDRTGYRFTAGMGTWSFDKRGKSIGSWDPEGLPIRLYRMLQMEWPGANNDLGSMMQDYTPKGYVP